MALHAEALTHAELAKRHIPTNILALMALRRVSRAQAQAVTGLSKPSLSERLSGKTPFKDYELLALAELLEVEVGVLFLPPEELLRSRCIGLPAGQEQGELLTRDGVAWNRTAELVSV